jgi:hypothetical protein
MKRVKRLLKCPLWNEAIGDDLIRKRSREDALFSALIKRLGEDEGFFHAVRRLKLKDSAQIGILMVACFQAQKLEREFLDRVAEAEKALKRFKELDIAVAKLSTLVSEQEKNSVGTGGWRGVGQKDGLALKKTRPKEFSRMKAGLCLLARLIEGQRYIAETTPAIIGATRKKRQEPSAPVNAGIRHLGKAIKRITGRPHAREVADLAEALFHTEITKDRVNGALRNPTRRKTLAHSPRKKRPNAP